MNKHEQKNPLWHKINVFHLLTFYRFFHISCENCKFKTYCEPIKHKREICEIANKTRKLLAPYTFGHVSSFASDDFYIKPETKNNIQKQEIKNLLLKIWLKYTVKTK